MTGLVELKTLFLIISVSLLFGCFYFGTLPSSITTPHLKLKVQSVHEKLNESTESGNINITSVSFRIFYWTSSHYKGRNWFGLGTEPFKSCKYTNCLSTNDQSELLTSDAVLFTAAFLRNFPPARLPNQKWIIHTHESPANEPSYEKYNSIFNVTWTYDRTSDIWTNYSHGYSLHGGMFVKRAVTNSTLKSKDYASGRKRLVAWFVSNCNAKSKRQTYVKQLKKYIGVDIYGKCGGTYLKPGHRPGSIRLLKQHYKFYLSFENSLCDDYVTEKLWRAIIADVIPVVLGSYNYSELMPPHSYIDIKNFDSPKTLAEYLVMLDKNDALYNKYLTWKGEYEIVRHPPPQCNLCEYLNVAKDVRKIYDRLDLYWDPNTKCYPPGVFYKGIDKRVWI